MSEPLLRIENQLDRIDLALVEGRLDRLDLEEWTTPDEELTPDQEARIRLLLHRVQATIARVEEAKSQTAAALEELRRRRSAARAYSA